MAQAIADVVGGGTPDQVQRKLAQYHIAIPSQFLLTMWSDEVGYRAQQLDEIHAGEAVWGGVLDNAEALRYDQTVNGHDPDASE